MISAFEQLCDILDDELVRQETLYTLLLEQRKGAIARDIHFMQAKTAAMECLVAESAVAESARHAVLRELVALTGLRPEDQTLTMLISHAPPKLGQRLAETQQRLQQVMDDAQAVAKMNGSAIRRAITIVDSVLDIVDHEAPHRSAYTATGPGTGTQRGALVLDQRG